MFKDYESLLDKLTNKISPILQSLSYKEYPIKVEDYYSNEKDTVYFIIRLNKKRTVSKVNLKDIVSEKDFFNNIHPYIGYSIGILHQLLSKNINVELAKIADLLYTCNNEKIKPIIKFCGINYSKKSLQFKCIHSENIYNISLDSFLGCPLIIRALHPSNAFTLGCIITEFLIDK